MCFERETNKELIEKCQELLKSKNELVRKLRESTTNSKLKLCPQCGGEVALLYDACVNGYYIVPKEKITVVIARASGLCVTTGKR